MHAFYPPPSFSSTLRSIRGTKQLKWLKTTSRPKGRGVHSTKISVPNPKLVIWQWGWCEGLYAEHKVGWFTHDVSPSPFIPMGKLFFLSGVFSIYTLVVLWLWLYPPYTYLNLLVYTKDTSIRTLVLGITAHLLLPIKKNAFIVGMTEFCCLKYLDTKYWRDKFCFSEV